MRQIRALLGAGLSTQVIARVLPCASGDELELETCPDLVRMLYRELAAIDDRIETLRKNRGNLAGYLP